MSSARGSISPISVFDVNDGQPDVYTNPTTSGDDQEHEYDLKPPPPSVSHYNIEILAGRLFSEAHLNLVLRDQKTRFYKFLQQFRPNLVPVLDRHLECRKAVLAIQYANAIAEQYQSSHGGVSYSAASIHEQFEEQAQSGIEELVSDALPAYITQRLVQLVTDSLVKEITGNSAPIMREMIPALAEVYCITDPSLPDNPIVYASEEFYNVTQYGRDYVVGRNCRFLQGPKTSKASVRRLVEALAAGQEITETMLNYARDGTAFMNLLMIAPLYDNKGTVRYFLGCQIDVSSLVEGGRGLESFATLLEGDRADSRFGGEPDRRPAKVLSDLMQILSEEEIHGVKGRRPSEPLVSGLSTPMTSMRGRGARRMIGMDDADPDAGMWPHPSLGPSGRLPGVYQNYLLVRPYPSLRVTFTSPALRIPGLLQAKFLDRIGGPQSIREGLLDALAHGTSVTAKVTWLTSASAASGDRSRGSMDGRTRWIHCTPMLGSDDKVGVWMILMVEKEEVTGLLNARRPSMESAASTQHLGAAHPRFTGNKLYAEYLRREGRSISNPIHETTLPSRESSNSKRVGTDPRPFAAF